MSNIEPFRLNLRLLREGRTTLALDVDDAFFAAMGGEVGGGQLRTTMTVDRAGRTFDVSFHTEGVVTVPCDLCLDDMQVPVVADDQLVARLGDGATDLGDEVAVVDEDEGILDTAWPVYQSIYLAIPLRHVHEPGKCNDAMTRLLNEHLAARSGAEDDAGSVDNGWRQALQGIKLND